MLTEMVDTMSLTLLMLGVEPTEATLDDVAKAKERLVAQREAGIVRKYYGQDYTDDMAAGNTWATMAWSGDVFYYKYLGGAPNLEFVVPEEGGMLWVTPLEIPVAAQHPTDAHEFLDWFYRPDIAVQVTDWVLYMTPVDGVQDLMRAKAEQSADDMAQMQRVARQETGEQHREQCPQRRDQTRFRCGCKLQRCEIEDVEDEQPIDTEGE